MHSHIRASYHDGGFTDFVLFNAQAGAVDPALQAQLEMKIPAHVAGLPIGIAALAAQRQFLASFMQRYLDRHEAQ